MITQLRATVVALAVLVATATSAWASPASDLVEEVATVRADFPLEHPPWKDEDTDAQAHLNLQRLEMRLEMLEGTAAGVSAGDRKDGPVADALAYVEGIRRKLPEWQALVPKRAELRQAAEDLRMAYLERTGAVGALLDLAWAVREGQAQVDGDVDRALAAWAQAAALPAFHADCDGRFGAVVTKPRDPAPRRKEFACAETRDLRGLLGPFFVATAHEAVKRLAADLADGTRGFEEAGRIDARLLDRLPAMGTTLAEERARLAPLFVAAGEEVPAALLAPAEDVLKRFRERLPDVLARSKVVNKKKAPAPVSAALRAAVAAVRVRGGAPTPGATWVHDAWTVEKDLDGRPTGRSTSATAVGAVAGEPFCRAYVAVVSQDWDPARRRWDPTVDVSFEAAVQLIRCP